MGLMKGQFVFLVTNPNVFIKKKKKKKTFIIISGGSLSDFIKWCMLSSFECACTLFKASMCA